MADTLPNCLKCKYYYITYDATIGHGCRAMKFKSAKNPAQVVFASSGMHCQLFMLKKADGITGRKKRMIAQKMPFRGAGDSKETVAAARDRDVGL